jgi:hypothetical protein
MINVIVGTSTSRVNKLYQGGTSIRTILEDNAVDYSTAQIMLDGANLQPGDMDKTLSDFNITEKCMLVAVVKAANA